ncbi:MAG: hypothetical protein WCL32_10840 [Planctomycetota bacterium]
MARTTLLRHLRRAFGWNLAKVTPTASEKADLAAAGVVDAAAVRYAVWRRSLLLVALAPTAISFGLAAFDMIEGGFGDLTPLGLSLEIAWLAAAAGLTAACVLGIRKWTRPASASGLLTAAWAFAFVLPFVFALMPAGLLYRVGSMTPLAHPPLPEMNSKLAKVLPVEERKIDLAPEQLRKFLAVKEIVIEFILSATAYLLLLPAVLSLIPGAVNGCLRVKALLPAAQLPGWLLVCAAPVFLLFWLIILVVANHVARSPLLVFGVLFWAGAPIWYAIRGRVFVQSHIGDAEAAGIAQVKHLVLATTLVGVGLLAAFALTTKVMGINILGFDRSTAVATKIEELSDDGDVSWEDVQTALAESTSFIDALDLTSWRLAVDFLAKLLVVTAVFADLVLRATLSAWKNDKSFRSHPGAPGYDATAAATAEFFGSPARTTP